MRKQIEGHPDYIISSVGYVIKKSTGKRLAYLAAPAKA